MDCGQRFKTRNTYKRHLKTRHGKLLTASGISLLSQEEFAKVRTRRYHIPRLPAIGYKMPELTFTKLKQQKSTTDSSKDLEVGEDESVILEELKADIKKESESGNESDPELVDILEALQQSTSAKDPSETRIKKEPGLEEVQHRPRPATIKTGVYVNNINKEIGEALLGINV